MAQFLAIRPRMTRCEYCGCIWGYAITAERFLLHLKQDHPLAYQERADQYRDILELQRMVNLEDKR